MSISNLIIKYDWPDTQSDLDTKTTFYFNQGVFISDEQADAYLYDGSTYIYTRSGFYDDKPYYTGSEGDIYWDSGQFLWIVNRFPFSGFSSEDTTYPWMVSSTGWSGDLSIYNLYKQPDPKKQESVGFAISGTYGNYSGDYIWQTTSDNTVSGPEIVFIDLDKAYRSGVIISGEIVVDCHADWYPSAGGSGPASLYVEYNNQIEHYQINPRPASAGVTPASTSVKKISFKLDPLIFQFNITGTGEVRYNKYSFEPLYEIEPIFNLNTGDLQNTASGLIINSKKDINLELALSDRNLNELSTQKDIIENPYIKNISVDVLDKNGNVVYENYYNNNLINEIKINESDNILIFGEYEPDFGLKIKIEDVLSGVQENNIFLYSNPLQFKNVTVNDSRGLWLNNNPANFYTGYAPLTGYESEFFLYKTSDNNAAYWRKYNTILSGYNLKINGEIVFGLLSGESVAIDWGDGSRDLIFIQTGITGGFSGSGVFSTGTNIDDPAITGFLYPTGINGNTYSFTAQHNYYTGSGQQPALYYPMAYYSGLNSTSEDLINNSTLFIPHESYIYGSRILGDSVTGKIFIEFEFDNKDGYVNPDHVDIFISENASIITNNENYLGRYDLINESGLVRNFTLKGESLIKNKDIWLSLIPYSNNKKGYQWNVGPYIVYDYQTPININSSSKIELQNESSTLTSEFLNAKITGSGLVVIDENIKSDPHFSYSYLIQVNDAQNHFCSTKILIVDNSVGFDLTRTGISFSQSDISDDSFIDYSFGHDNEKIYLYAKHSYENYTGSAEGLVSNFKIYKTSI